MTPAASLTDLVESLEARSDDFRVYFDRQTGRVVSVEETVLSAVEEGDEDNLLDWQQDEVDVARAIIEDKSDRFIDPPDPVEFNEYRHMQEFINTILDNRMATQLAISIRGEGAFGRFKDTLRNFGIQGEWYEYRTQAMKEFAIEWAEENDIACQDDLRKTRKKNSPRYRPV